MTNPTPHGQVPEALRLSERISDIMCAAEEDARAIAEAADELVRQYIRIAELEAQIAAVGAGGVSGPLVGRAPADSVTAPAGGIPGNFITHRASWREALETSKAHATGDDVTYWDHELRAFDRSFDRLWELMQASPTPPAEQQAQSAGPCVICGSDEPFTGTCGSGDPRALCKQAAPNAAPQEETNAQLDTDSNSPTPGQQRDVAGQVAVGQPVGHGSDSTAGDHSAQRNKLLTVAERNIRSFLRSAVFKSESDREAALNCVDVLWEAAYATASSQPAPAPLSDDAKDAARYRWLRNKSTVLHGTAWLGSATAYQRDVDFLRRDDALAALDAAIDAAIAAQGGK